MSDPSLEDLIPAYLNRELSDELTARVDAYLDAVPGRRGLIQGVKAAVRAEDVGVRPSPDVVFARLQQSMRLVETDTSVKANVTAGLETSRASHRDRTSAASRRFVRYSARYWIAGLSAVFLAGVVAVRFGHVVSSPTPGVSVQTEVAQHTAVTLRDGTRVRLAPQTTLTLADDFGPRSRTVHLSGEAYFDVNNAATAPFIVHTGIVTTRVLGTGFSVRHYQSDPAVVVAVRSGRVAVSRRDVPILLTAGDAAQMTDSVTRRLTTNQLTQTVRWEDRRLIFKEASVEELLQSLGRWYGYDFRVTSGALPHSTVSAVFLLDDRQEMLTLLRALLEAELTVDGRIVTLKPRVSTRRTPEHRPQHDAVFSPTMEVGK